MVKITNYEVYADRGDGWKLEDRFSSEQRHESINFAKELEQDKVPVKIIREVFDVQDNSYTENIEYISGLANKDNNKNTSSKGVNSIVAAGYEDEIGPGEKSSSSQNMLKAILKLLAIIVLCLVFANVLVTLLVPVIEIFATEETAKNLMFIVFFVIFLLLAVPLILKKVPWDAFVSRIENPKAVFDEKKFFSKADAIIRRYNLNDQFSETIAPAYPEAPLEYKRYIVDFLSQIISHLDTHVSMKDNFTRLGVKLVVYGGCLELSRYSGLILSEANSLLYEAFQIIDGDKADVEAFYEAKKTYRDNKVAIFLTGVGAYLMAQIIAGRNLDIGILKATFDKWEDLNHSRIQAEENEQEQQEVEIVFTCVGNIKSTIKFYEDEGSRENEKIERVGGDIRNIVANLVTKYKGKNVIEKDDITSVQFGKLNDAIRFTIDCLGDINAYQEESDNPDIFIENRCSVLEVSTTEDVNLSPYIEDVFEQTYDNEIIVDENIKQELAVGKYSVDFLGDKKLHKINKTVALYKLIY